MTIKSLLVPMLASLLITGCQQKSHTTSTTTTVETKQGQGEEKPLMFKTAWSVVFADIYGGHQPAVARQLWPAMSPEDSATHATKYFKPVPARFEMWAIERDASILEVMQTVAKDGYFIADPYQVKQFVKKSAVPESVWPLEKEQYHTVAVSRFFRYYGCRGWEEPEKSECIPPAVFWYKGGGEWKEMNQSDNWVKNPTVPAHTNVLLVKVLPGTLRHYGI